MVSQRESMLLFVIKSNMSIHPARSVSESPDMLKCLQPNIVHCSCPSKNRSVRQQRTGRREFRVLRYFYDDINVGYAFEIYYSFFLNLDFIY